MYIDILYIHTRILNYKYAMLVDTMVSESPSFSSPGFVWGRSHDRTRYRMKIVWTASCYSQGREH